MPNSDLLLTTAGPPQAASVAAATLLSAGAAQSADIVIFTSPATVRFAFVLVPRLRLRRTTRVCVPGSGSARALQRRGVKNVIYPPARRDSEGLLELPLFARLSDGFERCMLGLSLVREELRRRKALPAPELN